MPAERWRPDPARTERILRRVRAALEPVAARIVEALRGRHTPGSRLDPVTITASGAVWAGLGLAFDDLEPYALEVRAAELRGLRGPEAVVFSLGHHEPALFVTEVVGALRAARQRMAARAARLEGCRECGGAIELPPGSWEHTWWIPPEADGGLWTPALAANEEAVPVTRVMLHETAARSALTALRTLGVADGRGARYHGPTGTAPAEVTR